MMYYFNNDHKINIGELSRNPQKAFKRVWEKKWLYVLSNSRPMGVILSLYHFRKLIGYQMESFSRYVKENVEIEI